MRALCFCHWADPSSLCARQPYLPGLFSHSKFCALASDRSTHAPCPMPHAPCPVASLPAGREEARRHRHDPSAVEVRNLGSPCSRPPARPLQSTNSLSWPSAATIPSSHIGGHRRLCHLATCPPSPSLSGYGRHCRSTSNEASTPSPVGLRCGCCESPSTPSRLPAALRCAALRCPARPGQARHTSR